MRKREWKESCGLRERGGAGAGGGVVLGVRETKKREREEEWDCRQQAGEKEET